jgi:hypothetical protein
MRGRASTTTERFVPRDDLTKAAQILKPTLQHSVSVLGGNPLAEKFLVEALAIRDWCCRVGDVLPVCRHYRWRWQIGGIPENELAR